MLTEPVETQPKRGENIINIMLHLHTCLSSHTETHKDTHAYTYSMHRCADALR